MGSDKALCQNEIESIKCEVAKLVLEQVLDFKSGKGMSAQPLVEALSVHVPHKEKEWTLFLSTPPAVAKTLKWHYLSLVMNNSSNTFSNQQKTISFLV